MNCVEFTTEQAQKHNFKKSRCETKQSLRLQKAGKYSRFVFLVFKQILFISMSHISQYLKQHFQHLNKCDANSEAGPVSVTSGGKA